MLSFSLFGEDEVQLLRPLKLSLTIVLRLWRRGYDNAQSEHTAKYMVGSKGPTLCYPGDSVLHEDEDREFRNLHAVERRGRVHNVLRVEGVPRDSRERSQAYTVGERSPRAVTKAKEGGFSTITGNVSLPLERVVSWNVRLLRTKGNGSNVFVGVAPSDIDWGSDENNAPKCGWYFDCYESKLFSEPPHNFYDKEYEPRKGMENMSTQETVLALS